MRVKNLLMFSPDARGSRVTFSSLSEECQDPDFKSLWANQNTSILDQESALSCLEIFFLTQNNDRNTMLVTCLLLTSVLALD